MKDFLQKALLLLCWSFCTPFVVARIYEPIKWTFEQKNISETESELLLKATIDKGWHLYTTHIPEGGPVATTIVFDKIENAELVGNLQTPTNFEEKYDTNFDMRLSWFVDEAIFMQKITYINAADVRISGYVEFMACNDQTCLPPNTESFSFSTAKSAAISTQPLQLFSAPQTDFWEPVIDELRAFDNSNQTSSRSLWWVFFAGLLGGFIALFTPCVWPIIPMTVSFFLKRASNKARGKRDAVLYGLSIVIIYLFLGILITLIFGASALNSLSTNAFFNLFFFALLIVFAVSFFGVFEITLPASWSTKIDRKAENTSGILSILLMAFTLVLVSFSCTGPIIGTLLVEVAGNSLLAPAIGMLGFAIALSLPFGLFAFFPTVLKALPQSGGWLNSVKVVLAFLELALSLKFLSVADLAYGWHLLDREVFIALWIVIFALLGFYLLGKIKFKHDADLAHISVSRLFLATASLAFAVYMVPGLWGAPLKAISAFAPPISTQDFNLYENNVHSQFNNFEAGMKYAADVHKPVIIDFSGYGCVNCRKMEAAVWTNPKVAQILQNEYVLITLFVDDKTPLSEPQTIIENGKERTLRTIGDKWSYLQRSKFGANAQPFYVQLDNAGKPINKTYAFDENPENFVKWLKRENIKH